MDYPINWKTALAFVMCPEFLGADSSVLLRASRIIGLDENVNTIINN
jgi:hypothetical protein